MRKNREMVEGIIVPISWGKSGEVNKVSIYTCEDEDVILRHHYKLKLIKKLLNKKVRVFGSMSEESDDGRVFSVKRVVRRKFFNIAQEEILGAA